MCFPPPPSCSGQVPWIPGWKTMLSIPIFFLLLLWFFFSFWTKLLHPHIYILTACRPRPRPRPRGRRRPRHPQRRRPRRRRHPQPGHLAAAPGHAGDRDRASCTYIPPLPFSSLLTVPVLTLGCDGMYRPTAACSPSPTTPSAPRSGPSWSRMRTISRSCRSRTCGRVCWMILRFWSRIRWSSMCRLRGICMRWRRGGLLGWSRRFNWLAAGGWILEAG